ncbi:MAG: transposase, partial [Thermoplasmata archaeon]|nr:transposase [Thermoplasmata archaeon]
MGSAYRFPNQRLEGIPMVRKRSKCTGEKHKRYKSGYWTRYKNLRAYRFVRVIYNIRQRLEKREDPYTAKPPGTVGRPPIPPKVILICILIKVLLDLSYIDTEGFLHWVCGNRRFLLEKVPDANTIQEHVKDIPEKYLEEMILECMKIFQGENLTIILDSTGHSTVQYGCWRHSRTASKTEKRKFVKLHLIIETKRNLILVARVTKGWKGDPKFGERMLNKLKSRVREYEVRIEKALADASYAARYIVRVMREIN